MGCVGSGDARRQPVGNLEVLVRIDGKPAERVDVAYRWWFGGWAERHCHTLSLTTRADGCVHGVVPDVECRVDVTKPGFISAHRDVPYAEPAVGGRLVFDLIPEAPVRGIVVDARGEPVRNATVRAGSRNVHVPETRTNSTGAFYLSEVPAHAELRIEAYPFRPDSTLLPGFVYGIAPVETVSITLQDAGMVHLTVTGPDGRAVEPAGYKLDLVGGHTQARVTPDSGFPGGGTIGGLREGKYELRIRAIGIGSARSEIFEVWPGHLTVVRLALGSRTVSGRVVGERGQALRSAAVRAAGFELEAWTSPDGRFQLSELPSEAFELSVSANGYWPAQVTVPTGQTEIDPIQLSDCGFVRKR